MGVENNNALLAVTWKTQLVERLRLWVNAIPDNDAATSSVQTAMQLVRFLPMPCNGKTIVVVIPDGSKEGWPDSDYGDRVRNAVFERLKEDDYDDGSSPWDIIEVGFGEFGQAILRGNCINRYNDLPYAERIGS